MDIAGGTEPSGRIAELDVHDHLCFIYETPEQQFAAIVPYIRFGLERGEKCVYIVDHNEASTVPNALRSGGIDVESAVASNSLTILTKKDAYLKRGFFDPDWMIGFLKEACDAALASGYPALRATREMTWILGGEPGIERLI
jgi:hypothetical protein